MNKFTYPGKTAADINKELSTINTHSCIVHVMGINYIPLQSANNALRTLKSSLLHGVKQRSEYLAITMRQDMDSASKISKVNENIKSITEI